MSGWDAQYLLHGQALHEEARLPLLNFGLSSPSFFQTLGIETVRGRGVPEARPDSDVPGHDVSRRILRPIQLVPRRD
jgi:hypothetical protein